MQGGSKSPHSQIASASEIARRGFRSRCRSELFVRYSLTFCFCLRPGGRQPLFLTLEGFPDTKKRPFRSVTSRCQQAPRLRSLHPEEECRYKYGVTCAPRCAWRGANNAAGGANG